MSRLLVVDALLACLGLYIVKRLLTKPSSRPPLPPGPKPLPLLGNLLDLPAPGSEEWLHWAKYKEKFGEMTNSYFRTRTDFRFVGPISSLTVFGQHMIIINDLQLAFDTLDRRSGIYSDRPVLNFGGVM